MILHINGNYPHHSLHSELVSKLADFGDEQFVFVPMRGGEFRDKYRMERSDISYEYADILNSVDRVFFIAKVKKLAKAVEKAVDMDKVDCILAGTLYSDGAVAYILSKKHGIPYAVAVRNTDLNVHMKYRQYLNKLLHLIIENASNIILIAPSYKEPIQKRLRNSKCISEKFKVIPNAVNGFWFQSEPPKKMLHKPIELLFVGEVCRLKNLETVIKAIRIMMDKGYDAHFRIVGNGDRIKRCHRLAKSLGIADKVEFCGWQDSMEKIKSFYSTSDIFVMPSLTETFGTVYIEALSQGLPIIYTKGQGVDGYFPVGSVGFACDPKNAEEIAGRIIEIAGNYQAISKRSIAESRRFQWDAVAREYHSVLKMMMRRYRKDYAFWEYGELI